MSDLNNSNPRMMDPEDFFSENTQDINIEAPKSETMVFTPDRTQVFTPAGERTVVYTPPAVERTAIWTPPPQQQVAPAAAQPLPPVFPAPPAPSLPVSFTNLPEPVSTPVPQELPPPPPPLNLRDAPEKTIARETETRAQVERRSLPKLQLPRVDLNLPWPLIVKGGGVLALLAGIGFGIWTLIHPKVPLFGPQSVHFTDEQLQINRPHFQLKGEPEPVTLIWTDIQELYANSRLKASAEIH